MSTSWGLGVRVKHTLTAHPQQFRGQEAEMLVHPHGRSHELKPGTSEKGPPAPGKEIRNHAGARGRGLPSLLPEDCPWTALGDPILLSSCVHWP